VDTISVIFPQYGHFIFLVDHYAKIQDPTSCCCSRTGRAATSL